MKALQIGVAFVSLLAFPEAVTAELIPDRDIKQLVAVADTVILGKITELTDLGLTSIENRVGGAGARLVTGRISVHQVLKGAIDGPEVVFWSPVWKGALDAGQVALNQNAIIFLKRRSRDAEFASPFYPALRTVASSVSARDPLTAVVEALAAVLHSPQPSASAKRQAIYELKGLPMSTAAAGLRAALLDRDRSVQLEAAAALLTINDVEGLPYAEAALLRPSPVASGELLNLRVGLRGMKDPAAIPALARLLARGDASTKREAASALGQIKSPAALQPLGLALDDQDVEVRISAMQALGAATKQERLPSRDALREEEPRHIEEWKTRLAGLGVELR